MNAVTAEVFAILAKLPERQAKILHQLRLDVLKLVPAAQDRISYQMPTLEISGQILLHYAGFKTHNSIFAGAELPRRLVDDLGKMVASKGTIQFGQESMFPKALLKRS